jgi:hypothetical protein
LYHRAILLEAIPDATCHVRQNELVTVDTDRLHEVGQVFLADLLVHQALPAEQEQQ